ncbi:RNA degradosome polyphosphate kinase [Clostridium sp. DJ247]|uniref:RNA degradosome polyphosphate kinase n=1 Tax=Clostridium sp. DJ247 TaxID=2726188 RepID=UPI001624190F|nr:RNA degradosome polyphosphate kinase [Clostridium sp. DJ247]MBC2582860.1 RNA degradosome polyphosphate kinase [Clostridium sp. DJ247]
MTSNKYKPHNFINRELSWLEFNERVLEEAQDSNNPLLERLKFLSIASSNLDEFFMVRVGSLKDQLAVGFDKRDAAGLNAKEQLQHILIRTHKMVHDQYNCFNRSLIQALRKKNINLLKGEKLSKKQKEFVREYYIKSVYPVLTPMVVDKSRPFPLILNKSLNIAVLLENNEDREENIFATVQVPSVLGRLVELPSESNERCFTLMEEVIKLHMEELFKGHNIIDMGCYRITRNADLDFNEEGAEDLLEEIQQSLRRRKWGSVIRVETEQEIADKILNLLEEELEVDENSVYKIKGPLDLTFLMKLSSINGFEYLKYDKFRPQKSIEFKDSDNIFEAISSGDIMIHCPYESFDPVVELVEKAAEDPNVLAIKQTLYRVSGNSPIVNALAKAAENGKQVTVLVELKARFDEENNIIWAQRLEKAGCHVIYGLVGLKTHCKILLIVRREENGIKRYVHLSTGNYNDVTAKIYTDLSIFTSNPYFGTDASALFNMISGYSDLTQMYNFIIAPINMREEFIKLINRETENARNGKKAKIIAKVNALVDQEIIESLYDASSAGVDIDLIIRGICCLRPGVPGVSERIRVRSIVGRFLEHSRIYYFYNNGEEDIYLSSADWMTRNLDRRVELLFPVKEEKNKRRLNEILNIYLKDTIKARILNKDGTYTKIDRRRKESINSQEYFYKEAAALVVAATIEKRDKFEPINSYNL